MFEKGDIVKIQPHGNSKCMKDSPAWNLEDSICRVVCFHNVGNYMPKRAYTLEILEPHIKNKKIYYGDEGKMNWLDDHLVLVKDRIEIDDNEIINIIN